MNFKKILYLSIAIFFGCNQNQYVEKTDIVMGSILSIKMYSPKSYFKIQKGIKIIKDIDKDISLTNKNSDINKINNNPLIWVKISKNSYEVIRLSILYAKQSNNFFNPMLGKLTSLWDFNSEEKNIPDNEKILSYLAYNDYRNIFLNNETSSIKLSTPKTAFDLGGIGKGYACDKAIQYFKIKNVKSALINLGGNVQTLGKKPNGDLWQISIQEPFEAIGKHIGILSVGEAAIVTSGKYQKYFMNAGKIYHHILDYKTGYPANNNLAAVTIITDSGAYADALSTAIFAMGLEEGLKFIENNANIKAIFITDEKKIYLTGNLKDRFKLTSDQYKIVEN